MKIKLYNRRQFVKGAGAVSAAVLACSALPARLMAAPVLGQDMDQEMRLIMGTTVTIILHGQAREQRLQALSQAFESMDQGIAVFDRHNSNSALGMLNSTGRLSDAPKSLIYVLEQSARLGLDSGHLFNPALLPALALLESHKTTRANLRVDKSQLRAALELADPVAIKVQENDIRLEKTGMGLTLDGIAKGYIVDMAALELRNQGFDNFLINAGGDIMASGLNPSGQPWALGIANPANPKVCVASKCLSNMSMATSGGYERFFDSSKQTNHLLNPLTGTSPSVGSVTVVAPSAIRADALATAAAMMPPASALNFVEAYAGSSCLIIGRAGEVYKSSRWQA